MLHGADIARYEIYSSKLTISSNNLYSSVYQVYGEHKILGPKVD